MRRLEPRWDVDPPRREAAFRRTRRQALGFGLSRGAMVGVVAAGLTTAALADRWLEGTHGPRDSGWWILAAFGVPAAVGALVGGAFGGRAGVDADALGLRVVPGAVRGCTWADIVDLRAERRRQRTVVAAYLDSGGAMRLGVPYDGPLFDHDPDFERKLFTLQNLWEIHRNSRRRA